MVTYIVMSVNLFLFTSQVKTQGIFTGPDGKITVDGQVIMCKKSGWLKGLSCITDFTIKITHVLMLVAQKNWLYKGLHSGVSVIRHVIQALLK